jgi:hypothetical protein
MNSASAAGIKNAGFTMDNKIYDFQKNLRKWIERVKVVCFDIGSSPTL